MRAYALVALAMVAAAAAAAAATTAAAAAADGDAPRAAFAAWRERHGKAYESAEEEEHRFGVFRANAARVEAHAREFAEGKHTYELGLNAFSDLAPEEFRRRYASGYRPRGARLNESRAAFAVQAAAALPSSWDWRDQGLVGSVKNQDVCDVCWVFAAVAALEGLHAKETGRHVPLSEQQFVDCVRPGNTAECSQGGHPEEAFQYAVAQGVESERQYPYYGNSFNACHHYKFRTAASDAKSFSNIRTGDTTSVLSAVAQFPVLAAAVNADDWQHYSGGVHKPSSCPNSLQDMTHAVAIVGFTEDAVIVRNSWGDSWGEGGYMRLARDGNTCGWANDASFPSTSA